MNSRKDVPSNIFRLSLAVMVSSIAALLALHPAAAFAAGSATTQPATKVHHTTAVLNGHLDPEGDPGIVSCQFEWGTTPAYGNTAPCAEGNSFSSPADVSALLSGLEAGTTYHFRLDVETTSSGSVQGVDLSFTTRLAPLERSLVASFGSNGTSGSSYGIVNQITIDQARRKLYVFDRSAKQIYGYDISAPPPSFPGAAGFSTVQLDGSYNFPPAPLAADSTTALGSSGNLYFGTDVTKEFTHPGQLAGYSPSGTSLSGFPVDPMVNPGPPQAKFDYEPYITGAAVSPSGEIWITLNEGPDVFYRYSSDGAYSGSVSQPTASVGSFAFDSNGDLYASSAVENSIWRYAAASSYTVATKIASNLAQAGSIQGLAVDPSTHDIYVTTYEGLKILGSNGERFDEIAGDFGEEAVAVDPANHHLYVARKSKVEVYAPGAPLVTLNTTTAPAAPIAGATATLNGFVDPEGTAVSSCKFEWGSTHGSISSSLAPCASGPGSGSGDVAVSAQISGLEPGQTYQYRLVASNGSATERGGVKEFTTNPLPGVGSPAVSSLTADSAKIEASVEPKGFDTRYRFEYGSTSAYGTTVPVPDGDAGSSTGSVNVSAQISGLNADTTYHWRIVAESENGSKTLPDQIFVSYGPVKAETVGSPIRTTTTARLEGRVAPDGVPSTFHFEYGTEGPCDSNPCTALPSHAAGSGASYELVSEPLEGLQPNTTYHYRVVAENGQGSPSYGDDMTVSTRASDAPLSHGHFPGPPGSDRAYEQVSLPDAGGNPVSSLNAVSDNGERVLYAIHGGNPISSFGSQLNEVFSERTASGWQNMNIFPSREESLGSGWIEPYANADLSALTSVNGSGEVGLTALYRLFPGGQPGKVWGPPTRQGFLEPQVSADLSLMTVVIATAGKSDVFDITSGTPEEIDQLPDGSFPACGARQESEHLARATHWLSADGTLSYFSSSGNSCGTARQLYVRNLEAGETKRVSPPPVSGGSCQAYLIRSTPGAAFFWTQSRLTAADAQPSECRSEGGQGGDVYRYDLADESVECLTCIGPGIEADVRGDQDMGSAIAVAEDGSRVYFNSPNTLVPGGGPGIYRVNVGSGEISYVGAGGEVGTSTALGEAISPDGKTLVFTSKSPDLNAIGGQQNGGTLQYYLYDDEDRSLVCASCPQDGTTPSGVVNPLLLLDRERTGPNMSPISTDGGVFAFATATPLVEVDQNTPPEGQDSGTDVYEWRDGRLLLVTDGLTNWPSSPRKGGGEEIEVPHVAGVSPSGRDIYFAASIQYTPDALDGYRRLYDARIGGGFEFPPPPKPCPLEVCQGTPKGTPEEQAPGTDSFAGAGNAKPPARHAKKHKKKAHKKARHHKANNKRRAAR